MSMKTHGWDPAVTNGISFGPLTSELDYFQGSDSKDARIGLWPAGFIATGRSQTLKAEMLALQPFCWHEGKQ